MSTASTNIINNNQDIIFFLNPSITYFKSVYRKHTKFVITYKEESVEGGFADSAEIPIELNFDADLLCDISLKVTVDKSSNPLSCNLPNNLQLFLIENVKFTLSGKLDDFDILNKDYINFQAMLDNPKSLNSTYSVDETGEVTCNNGNNYQNISLCGGVQSKNDTKHIIKKMNAVIPLPFAFSKSIGNAIPLCALNMRNITPTIVLSRVDIGQDVNNFIFEGEQDNNSDNNNHIIRSLFKYSTITKYIFLSDSERYRFKNSKQEYLYERVNLLNSDSLDFFNNETNANNININNSNNTCSIKSLFLYNKVENNFNKNRYKIFINNQPLFTDFFNHEFFSKVEILNKFKGCIYDGNNSGHNVLINNNIALIDFSLKNSEGPSGSISTITNNIDLKINNLTEGKTFNTKIYACCYYLLSINNEEIRYVFN